MTEPEPIPLIIRTRLAHAALQAAADECGADILHIKGAAVDLSLLPQREDAPLEATPEGRVVARVSVDADILVRPAHLRQFLTSLQRNGWQKKTQFYSSGVVEHSVDWWHPVLGHVDLHVRFPGIRLARDQAYAFLWQERITGNIAHRQCWVPSVTAQRLILLLHAARSGNRSSDVEQVWTRASDTEQATTRDLACRLRAEVALAGAIGELDSYVDRPDYDLWRLLGKADRDLFALWLAYVKAAPTVTDRANAIRYAWRLKADRVDIALQHRATKQEVASAHMARLCRGTVGLWKHLATGTPALRRRFGREDRKSS